MHLLGLPAVLLPHFLRSVLHPRFICQLLLFVFTNELKAMSTRLSSASASIWTQTVSSGEDSRMTRSCGAWERLLAMALTGKDGCV